MEQPKFIITADGYLRLGMVNMHKDLLLPDNECNEVDAVFDFMPIFRSRPQYPFRTFT